METLTILILILVMAVLVQVCSEDLYNWVMWMCGCKGTNTTMSKWKNEKNDLNNLNNLNKTDDVEGYSNGALQSLYANDGIQDINLTVNNDNGWGYGGHYPGYGLGYDGYRYWRGVPWYLPTRNLHRVSYYPYLYEYYLDRYGRFYPYW